MKTFEYQVQFNSPALLGNAEQNAQWRTPPFKALLRQWWRMAWAAEKKFQGDVAAMRHEEGLLFGHAWLENDLDAHGQKTAARKSALRMRLSSWSEGSATSWQPLAKVTHPEVRFPVGSDLYLGYGPIRLPSGARVPELKANAAIQSGETANLSIAVPEAHAPLIEQALILMNRYGTAGGRSRNGWGSFSLNPSPAGGGGTPLRFWRDCLDRDWPHALGKDEQGALIWQTKSFDDWKTLMRELAIIKIGLRTQFPFNSGNNAAHPEARHWLSHPVTRHNVGAWRQRQYRLPNSLRFKIRPAPQDLKKCVGVIFHVPCLPPRDFAPHRNAIEQTWQAVYDLLNELTKPSGRRGYASITDKERRATLKPQLDTVTLSRISE